MAAFVTGARFAYRVKTADCAPDLITSTDCEFHITINYRGHEDSEQHVAQWEDTSEKVCPTDASKQGFHHTTDMNGISNGEEILLE